MSELVHASALILPTVLQRHATFASHRVRPCHLFPLLPPSPEDLEAYAGIPFVTLNTCASALTFYGLVGLRYEWRSILIAMAITTLHTLIAQQFAIWAVWTTTSQVRRPLASPVQPVMFHNNKTPQLAWVKAGPQ